LIDLQPNIIGAILLVISRRQIINVDQAFWIKCRFVDRIKKPAYDRSNYM
jgi:hypothetical protein